MKTRHTLILIIVGLSLDVVGGLLKILHLNGADEILIFATILQVVGSLSFLFKLLTNPKAKEFLDW